MKVLITGAGGQLGLDLLDAFADLDPVGLTRQQLDISDEAAVSDSVLGSSPDLVINTASWTDVDGCEQDPDRAHRVNALGPWWLARACARLDATLVFSTDYVFSGNPPTGPGGRPRGWTEHDPIAPINEYGRSKDAGEALVREALASHHIVRTSWLNGARGHSFVRTMLRLANERDYLEVVDDETGCPTFTRDLSAAIRRLAESGRYGTVNVSNSAFCTWYEFACATFELGGLEVEVHPTSASMFGRLAPRPGWSVLDTRHARTGGLGQLQPRRDALRALLKEMSLG